MPSWTTVKVADVAADGVVACATPIGGAIDGGERREEEEVEEEEWRRGRGLLLLLMRMSEPMFSICYYRFILLEE